MPVQKLETDKFEHLIESEPERDGLDYGPNDDFMEIVSSWPADDGKPEGDNLEADYSQDQSDDELDLGGKNFSRDTVKPEKTAEPEPDTKDGENTDEPEPEAKPEKEETPASKRISQVIRERNKAQEEAAYYKGLAEGQARKPAGEADTPEINGEGKPKPLLADFESYEDYTEAMQNWGFEQRDLKAAAERAQAAKQKTLNTFSANLRAGEKKHDDFKQVVNDPNLAINDVMIEAMMDADHPDDIAYHLGKNPDDAQRISELSAVAAAREIGKLDAKFETPKGETTKTPPKTTTKAPAPIEPVNTGARDVTTKDPESMSMDEYVNWRTKGGKVRV